MGLQGFSYYPAIPGSGVVILMPHMSSPLQRALLKSAADVNALRLLSGAARAYS